VITSASTSPQVPTASADRRDVGGSTPGAAGLVREVGGNFLRARPWIVLPVALANAALMVATAAPLAQRRALAASIAVALALFVAEAWWCQARAVSGRWLATSLAITVVALGTGCGLSGGLASPLVPLLLAPVVVGVAAFAGSRIAVALTTLFVGVLVALALVPRGWPWPPLGAPAVPWMYAASTAGTVALAYVGVTAVVAAHTRAATVLDRLRVATAAAASARDRATEAIGARVAHELKNPLAAVKAMVQLLAEDRDSARRPQRAAVALTEIDRMDATVRDYLAMTRPLVALVAAPVSLGELAADVAALVATQADRGEITVRSSGTATVIGDGQRLREAILNLVGNALAVTPRQGQIVIAVAATTDGGGRVEVRDTGPGLPAIPSLRPGGSGLGLALTRAAVELHGGVLTLTAAPGGGTLATITVPARPPGEPA
jgi:signal transduction histidine kinase